MARANGARQAFAALDGNEAAARVAYALSEVIAIYPITPSSTMGEEADQWSQEGRANIWGSVPRVVEMQSEAGAAGALHGALSAGSLATTFTASQGLLLMIPTMYKIAGELSPFVMHVAARALAAHALSIFGDHSDVMAARGTGFALLASGSVQEAADLALVAHAATHKSRVPFLHFFDGFRTSHEIAKIRPLRDDDLRALVPAEEIVKHRLRGLSPDRPSVRGTAQNPDVFFQGRERANSFYLACPGHVQEAMYALARRTGRRYRLFDYAGDPHAERALVMMGSGAEAAEQAAEALAARGEKTGVIKVRLYRPFSVPDFLNALPTSVRSIAVLDRTKEPGSVGDPLYLDVCAALQEGGRRARVVGGRYGIASKEFTPAMAAAALGELAKADPKNHFTLGINDDLTATSLPFDPDFVREEGVYRAVFFGLGADGTVGANKAAVKLIAEHTPLHAQAYFVYDSKKSGSATVSHLRFGPRPIHAPYLIREADFVACHQESLVDRLRVLDGAVEGGIFLLNCAEPEKAWQRLSRETQETLIAKKLKFYAVDAHRLAREAGLGRRINTVMQACFFAISKVLPDYLEKLKEAAREAYASKGEAVIAANVRALELAAAALREVPLGVLADSPRRRANGVASEAPEFVRRVTAPIMAGRGDELPVSALPEDGVWPTGTSRWEKRRIAQEVPVWKEELCIQCNKCALVCPHAAIRVKAYAPEGLAGAPAGFKHMPWKGREFPAHSQYTVQVAPEDCTGCRLCVEVCPGQNRARPEEKSLAMAPADPLFDPEAKNFDFFLNIAPAETAAPCAPSVKFSQLKTPLFEFSGACAGCGETPYLKLLTQLFGDRMVVANATGCSSIYGANLPTTPWCQDERGRGPAWSNSLFENNAEFGLGMRLAFDKQADWASELLLRHAARLGRGLVADLIAARKAPPDGAALARAKIAELKEKLLVVDEPWARDLAVLAESLVARSVWLVGGDGWAYDIGYGGLDHVLRSGQKVNVLVLDTEVYSNTGGQASKATPRGAQALFASAGKAGARKDLAVSAIAQGDIYVARIAFGANDTQTLRAFVEAESFPGPSLVIAYCPCIAHGIEMSEGLSQQKLAVQSGYWPLLRFDPRRRDQGLAPLQLDSSAPKIPFKEYALRENRYRALLRENPEHAEALLAQAQKDVAERWRILAALAA